MALLTNDPTWRHVRAPLVALTDAQMTRPAALLAEFALDQARD